MALDMDVQALVDLAAAARDARVREGHRGLVQVMATAPATVARVTPMDDLGALAASLNDVDGRVTYVDRWSAAVRLGRADRP